MQTHASLRRRFRNRECFLCDLPSIPDILWQSIEEKVNLDKTTVPLVDESDYDFVALAGAGANYEITSEIDVYANYAESYGELKDLLEELEQGEIDVDELSAKVKRAAELIEFCQKRLKETEVEVKRVVEKFEKQMKNVGKEETAEQSD